MCPLVLRAQEGVAPSHREEWWVMNPDGCSNYVSEFGRGSPVIFIHGGLGAEHSYLLGAADGLQSDHRLVFYDQRGSLRSPFRVYQRSGSEACPDSLTTIGKHVEDLERLRTQLGYTRVSIVAHSMGAVIALQYLERHPDRVGGLVLLAPGVPLQPVEDRALLAKQKIRVNALFESPQIEREKQKAGIGNPPLTDKQKIEEWHIRYATANLFDVSKWRQLSGGMAFYNARAGAAASKSLPTAYDYVALLKTRRCPTAIVLGDHDIVDMGATTITRQVDGVLEIKLTVIRNAGHAVWIDKPKETREAIKNGLALCN